MNEIDIVNKAIQMGINVGLNAYKAMQSPTFLSENQAKKKYKGAFETWKRLGKLHPVAATPTRAKYIKEELDSLWEQWLFGTK